MCCLVHKLVVGNEPMFSQCSDGVQTRRYQFRVLKLGTLKTGAVFN